MLGARDEFRDAATGGYRFSTKELNARSGLVYFGARYYDPKIGRFITQDPLGPIDGPNLYVYTKNNPINNIDPDGLSTKKSCNFGDCFSNCFKSSGGYIALGILGISSPFTSFQYPFNKQLLGSSNPFTSLFSIVARWLGVSRGIIQLGRFINPYANVIAIAAASYAIGVSLTCVVICSGDCG